MNFKIGIIGLGFVGGAMFESFKLKGLIENKNIFIYDKYKNGGIGGFEDILNTNILFIALPTPYNDSKKEYDKTSIKDTFKKLQSKKYKGVIVIKSTIEPETTNELSKKFSNLKIVHNPEFLSAKTAFEDFHNQKHIVLGKGPNCKKKDILKLRLFYMIYYQDADISICTSLESESMKCFANSFYAVKIQYFTEMFFTCQKTGADFNKVKDMMLKNGWINPMHTNVPGTDGKVSYGGLCFPKDTNALNEFMKKNNIPNKVLDATINERNLMRDDNLNCELKEK